jgi:hypothetical protein
MMGLSEFLGNAAGPTGLLGFFVFIAVGWAHGGKNRMSLFDPALKNEISPLGIKFMFLGGGLILLAIVMALISVPIG